MTSNKPGDPAAPSSPVRILLVEDNPGDARLIAEMLEECGDLPTVLEMAGSIADAVDRLTTDTVDVVLLDLNLPDGRGTDTLDRILQVTGSAAVVVMTGIEDRRVAEQALERGAQDLLVKGDHDADALVRSINFAQRRRARLAHVEHQMAASQRHRDELQAILDGSPLPMVLVDRDRQMALVNWAARAMIGREITLGKTRLGEALGCQLCVSNPDECGRAPECMSCALRDTVADTFETGRQHRDVEVKLQPEGPSNRDPSWFRVATSRVTPAAQPMVLVSIEDVTAQRRSSERIRTLNRLLNTMLEIDELAVRETSPQALMDGACRSLVESGRFLFAWFAMTDDDGRFDFPASHGIDPQWLRLVEVELASNDGSGCAAVDAVRTGHTVRVDDVATDTRVAAWRDRLSEQGIASGVATPVPIAGAIGGALAVCASEPHGFEPETVHLIERLAGTIGLALASLDQDRARRAAEADLRTSETRYRLLFERNPAGVYRTTVDGRFLAANPALVEMLGFDVEAQLLGTPVASIYRNASDRDAFLETLLAAGAVENFEVELVRRDGTNCWALLNANLIDVADGMQLIEGTAIDITRRREVEEQLLHSQRLEAVGRLAGGVAHDFNNLLQAVTTQVRTLGPVRGDPDAFETRLGEIEDLVRRGAQMTRQLLIFARRETTRPEILDLSDVAHSAFSLLRRLVREDVRLTIDIAAERLPVQADRGELEQVVVNLAVNAQDAMPGGGQLTVRTRGANGYAILEVEDSGHGIPDDIRERVFEPFFTTKPASTGTGLGLSVARGIVERSGGQIELDSRIGEGTRLWVTLPMVDAPVAVKTVSQPTAPVPGTGGRVLLVEDEEGVREGLAEALDSVGYVVITVADLASARGALETATFDAVLSDLVLPDGSGIDLVRAIRSSDTRCGCILMSGYATDAIGDIDAALESGTVFLQKPFGLGRLVEALHQVIARDGGRADDGSRP